MRLLLLVGLLVALTVSPALAQPGHSVARQWNEVLLDAIRNDFARPTVHARNLFHTSVAMYDTWAAYDDLAETFCLGKTVDGFHCTFDGVDKPENVKAAREEAMSYAMYRILKYRFASAPGADEIMVLVEDKMAELGYDPDNTSTDYQSGDPAALGNYMAQCLIGLGQQDRSNEGDGFKNLYYFPSNPPLLPAEPGNPNIRDLNRWQPLVLDICRDQADNPIPCPGTGREFLSPEWGQVTHFSLHDEFLTTYERGGFQYRAYHDPGAPPHLNLEELTPESEQYKWSFLLVSVWSSHLDPSDGVMWDISPGAQGNYTDLPEGIEDYPEYYDLLEGGDPGRGTGHPVNPYTGRPYEPNIVPRGDYTRVLAEFWADGPSSETPPGHWFTILNYVNDHPAFEKRFAGTGPVLDDLEWDVKAYFTLGGGMHDVAVSSWGVKGWYDYIRPISAIRAMADLGQGSDPSLPNYHVAGIPLMDGFVELVEEGDALAGLGNENVGKIKLFAWRGPDYIDYADPEEKHTPLNDAGVGWILAENWWPYQRPSFVTPPFAGYVSGHSTFSRTAAILMTKLTGDPFFPGGMGVFEAKKNEFLVFEVGPSVDVTLQWATYQDASDQTSLSRIWGGIHPPADDIPGRKMGNEIAPEVFNEAVSYFRGLKTGTTLGPVLSVFPNPFRSGENAFVQINQSTSRVTMRLYDLQGRLLETQRNTLGTNERVVPLDVGDRAAGIYFLNVQGDTWETSQKLTITR